MKKYLLILVLLLGATSLRAQFVEIAPEPVGAQSPQVKIHICGLLVHENHPFR